MKAIDRKLWRELWAMRLQALAIAMVIVSGVSIFIMSLSTLDSLYETRESYYRQHHFAEVFASLKRAPLSLVKRIEELHGVGADVVVRPAGARRDVAGAPLGGYASPHHPEAVNLPPRVPRRATPRRPRGRWSSPSPRDRRR